MLTVAFPRSCPAFLGGQRLISIIHLLVVSFHVSMSRHPPHSFCFLFFFPSGIRRLSARMPLLHLPHWSKDGFPAQCLSSGLVPYIWDPGAPVCIILPRRRCKNRCLSDILECANVCFHRSIFAMFKCPHQHIPGMANEC